MEKMFTLTKRELEIMELLWEAGEPMDRAAMIKASQDRPCSWNPNSIHLILNAMMDKGAIEVEGIVQGSRKLARTFGTLVSKEEYYLMQVQLALEEAGRATGLSLSQCLAHMKKSFPESWK